MQLNKVPRQDLLLGGVGGGGGDNHFWSTTF